MRFRRPYPTFLAAPFAALVYVDSVYAGIHVFLDASYRLFLDTALPHYEVTIIAVALIAGGSVSFIGMLMDNPRIERGGLALFSAGILMTGITILVIGSLSFVNAWLNIMLAGAALIRFWRLGIGAQLRVEAGRGRRQ